ncbi:MAG: carbohydrate binding domain-containing protein [Anaerolineae bacterium]
METSFPEGNGFAGFFLVGYRKNPDPPHQIQRVGTAILKRTYDIAPSLNPAFGSVTPAAEALAVFDQDQPDMPEQTGNLVTNGDFEDEDISVWQPESGATIARVAEAGGSGDFMLRVTGDANKRVTQALVMPEALAGHKFTLTFAAKATVASNVTVQLRAGTTTICTVNAGLTPTLEWFTAEGRWPSTVSATEMQVVVRTASVDGRTVFYDDVNVFSRIRFEHDLAPFKPEGDIAVLDFLTVTGLTRFRVNDQTWLERTISSSDFDMFGWEPRAVDPRKGEAAFPEDDASYPLPEPLPSGFNNRFYNGYRRDALQLSALPYFSPGDQVRIQRPGPSDDYGFTLGNETVTAQVRYYRGYGPDEERYWLSQNVPVVADTLVIEPEKNCCYVIWRGVWDFDAHPEDAYRQLNVSVAES